MKKVILLIVVCFMAHGSPVAAKGKATSIPERDKLLSIMHKAVAINNVILDSNGQEGKATFRKYADEILIPHLSKMVRFLSQTKTDIDFCIEYFRMLDNLSNSAYEGFSYSTGQVYYANPDLVEKAFSQLSSTEIQFSLGSIRWGLENLEYGKPNDPKFGLLRQRLEKFTTPQDNEDASFQLSQPLTFFDPPLTTIKQSNIPGLLTRKGKSLTLIQDNGKKIKVETVGDYRKEIEAESYPLATQDMREVKDFILADQTLVLLEKAGLSKNNLPKDLFADLKKLPATLVTKSGFNPADQDQSTQAIKSVDELIRSHKAKILKVNSQRMTIQYDNAEITLWEVVRADFNNDGNEDSLLAINTQAIGGTLTGISTHVLDQLLP